MSSYMYLQFACYLIYSRMKQQSTRNELKISTRKMEKQTSSAQQREPNPTLKYSHNTLGADISGHFGPTPMF